MRTLTTYGEARAAFRSRDLRQALYDEGDHLMHGVIVNLHGDEHLARRRLENRLFRRDTFAWYELDRIPAIIDQVITPARRAGHGDLLPLARVTMMILTAEVAGVDRPEGTAQELAALSGLMDRLARASTVAHATGDKEAVIADGDAALAEFEERFYRPSLERRRRLVRRAVAGELDGGELPRDVLTTLLRNHDRLELPPETVLREVAYFPWVGSHSTSNQLVHAMHHCFAWIGADPERRAELAGDAMLRQRFVHESLRLHPASPVVLRHVLADVTLPSGVTLAAGELVAVQLDAANRDPSVFGPDADCFHPWRTLPDGVMPWGLSFGHGVHACLGQELAGGLEPGGEHHLYGAITVMAGALLGAGARPDPDHPAALDTTTTRHVWGAYPVLLDAP